MLTTLVSVLHTTSQSALPQPSVVLHIPAYTATQVLAVLGGGADGQDGRRARAPAAGAEGS